MIFRDNGRAGCSHRLARETVAVWFNMGDINDRVNVHGTGKVEFDGIGPDQLHDGIGAEPLLQELPRSAREAEIVG